MAVGYSCYHGELSADHEVVAGVLVVLMAKYQVAVVILLLL